MTSPPPIVPAPPPVAAAPPVTPADVKPAKTPPGPKTAAAPPPLIPAHRRRQAALVGGAGTAAGSTAAALGAAQAGIAPGFGVLGALGLAAGGAAGVVAVRRRMHRPVTAAAAPKAKPGLRARATARRDVAKERRGKLTERIRGALNQRRGSKSPAGPEAHSRGRRSGGAGPSRRRMGRQAPGVQPRSPGAPTPKRAGRLARAMPTRAGKAARAQRRAERAGGRGQPANSPTGGRTPRTTGSPGRRSRLGRAWDRRPGGAGRAARAATGAASGSGGGSSKAQRKAARKAQSAGAGTTRAPSGTGRRARRAARKAARNAPPTVAAPPAGKAKSGKKTRAAKTTKPAAPTPTGAGAKAAPVAAGAVPRTVWSSRRRDRRNLGVPAAPVQAGKGRWARLKARLNPVVASGSTKHVPWEEPPPPKGGGVGPVSPKAGPKPPGGPPGGSKEKPRVLTDDRVLATRGARTRRQDLADSQWGPAGLRDDPPQTDASWAAGFAPGPEPLAEDARTAARDRWQRRTSQGATVPGNKDPLGFHNARRGADGEIHDRAPATGMARPAAPWGTDDPYNGPSRGGGTGEIADMRTDMPRFEATAADAAEDLAADFRRRAAEVSDGTPSSQAVKDAWEALAAQQSAVAQATAELAGMSQRVDAVGHDAGDRYGHDPNFGKWAGR